MIKLCRIERDRTVVLGEAQSVVIDVNRYDM